MKTIHKCELQLKDIQEIRTMHPIKPLSVQIQRNAFCLWYETEAVQTSSVQNAPDPKTTLPFYQHAVHVVGTGQLIPRGNLEYIDTVQFGEYVWHFYLESFV